MLVMVTDSLPQALPTLTQNVILASSVAMAIISRTNIIEFKATIRSRRLQLYVRLKGTRICLAVFFEYITDTLVLDYLW
jgi:hypothetical protein